MPPRVKPRNYNRITNADNSGDDSRSRESQDRRSAERSRTSESDASRARKEGRNRGKRSRGRSRSRHEKKSPVLRRARRERQERSRREKDPKQEGVPEPEPTGKGDDSAPAKTKEEAGSSNREKAERRKETRKDRSGRKDKEKGGPLRIELPAFKEEKDKQKKGKARNAPAQTISRLKRRRKQHHRAVGLATSIVGVDCWAKIPLRNQVACQSRLPKSLKPQMVKRQHQVKERLQVGDKGRSSSLHPGAKCYDSRAAAAFPGSPALASYMSSNASLLNLSTEGLIMTRKTAVQSQGDLRRSGMPRADEQLKMLRDGILSGDLTRLEELVHVVDELEAKADLNTREGRQSLGDFSLAFRECGRAAREAAKDEKLTDHKGQLRIALWPWIVPPRRLTVHHDEKLSNQVIGELKKHNLFIDVKIRNAPLALDLVRKQPKESYDRETSLRGTRVIALALKEDAYDLMTKHNEQVTSAGSILTLLLKLRTAVMKTDHQKVIESCKSLGLPYTSHDGKVVCKPSPHVSKLMAHFAECYFTHGPEEGAQRTRLICKSIDSPNGPDGLSPDEKKEIHEMNEGSLHTVWRGFCSESSPETVRGWPVRLAYGRTSVLQPIKVKSTRPLWFRQSNVSLSQLGRVAFFQVGPPHLRNCSRQRGSWTGMHTIVYTGKCVILGTAPFSIQRI